VCMTEERAASLPTVVLPTGPSFALGPFFLEELEALVVHRL
jgi:hypothetical protein